MKHAEGHGGATVDQQGFQRPIVGGEHLRLSGVGEQHSPIAAGGVPGGLEDSFRNSRETFHTELFGG